MPSIDHFHVPFPRNTHFVGREEDLERLHEALQKKGPTGIIPAGLTGMGGIGKTQLAVEYAYRYEEHYPDGIFWLTATRPLADEFARIGRLFQDGQQRDVDTQVRLRQWLTGHFNEGEIMTLAADLGVIYEDLPAVGRANKARELVGYLANRGRLAELEEKIVQQRPALVEGGESRTATDKLVALAFNYFQTNPDSLVVLDNVGEPAVLKEPILLDYVPANLTTSVLFTTRDRQLHGFNPIELTVLPEKVALQLLLRDSERQSILDTVHPQHEVAKRICRTLGYLPLALEIAGAHLGGKAEVDLAVYLATLGDLGALKVVEIREIGGKQIKIAHRLGLEAVLKNQWENLPSKNARTLLKTAGQLPVAAIIPKARLGLLSGIGDEARNFFADTPLSEALRQLRNDSLIEWLEDDHIRLHPLVREFAFNQTPEEERGDFLAKCATNLVDAFEDPATLETQWRQRGIDALQEDLLATLELLIPPPETISEPLSIPPWRIVRQSGEQLSADDQQTLSRVQTLLRLLQREVHTLRGRAEDFSETHFAQQIAYRVWDLNLKSLLRRLTDYLTLKRRPIFMAQWAAKGESDALERTFTGHSSYVNAAAVTPNGRWAVSGSADGTLKVWNLTTGAEERTLEGHSSSVRAVMVTPDGRQVVSGSDDQTVRVWNLATGAEERTLAGHSSDVIAVAITPDGERVVSGSASGGLKVWNLTTGAEERTLAGHSLPVNAVAVAGGGSLDGMRVVSGSADGTLKVWNLATGIEERTLAGHSSYVNAVAVTGGGPLGGRRVVSGAADGTLKVWNLATGVEEQTLVGHSSSVRAAAVTPDGRRVVSASDDRTVRVWNLATGAEERMLAGHSSFINAAAVTPDGTRVISGSLDRTLKVWNLTTRIKEGTLSGHSSDVQTVLLAPDGRRVVTASSDGTLKVWNLATGVKERTLVGHSSHINAAAMTPDGRRVASASSDGTLKVWSLATGEEEWTLSGHSSYVNTVAVMGGGLPDGKQVVSGSADGTLKVWSLATGEEERTLVGHSSYVNVAVVTPDGKRVVSGSADGTLKVWNLVTGDEEWTLAGHSSYINEVVLTPDGRRAVSGSADGTLKVWNLATGEEEWTFSGHTSYVNVAAVTPDGKQVVSGSADGTLKVWNLATGVEERTLAGHSSYVLAVAVASDGMRVVSGSEDRSLKVWNLATGEQLASITLDGPLQCVALSLDGATVIAGDQGGSVYCLRYIEPDH